MNNKPFNRLLETDKEQLKQPNMKKRIYRIELTERDTIFTDMVLDAANSNGGNYVPLNEIDATARALCRKYPSAGKYHTVTLTGNVLTIDQESKNIVTITEIEVCELEKPSLSNQEAKDILSEVPTINRYEGTGIDDERNYENLN